MYDQDQGGRSVRKSTLNQRGNSRWVRKRGTRKKLRQNTTLIENEDLRNTGSREGEQSTSSVATTSRPIPPQPIGPNTTMSVPLEILAALSPDKRNQLADWITANRVTVNVPTIRVKQLNTNIKPPVFDELRKTPAAYLTALEAYFRSQGFDDGEFLNLLPSVLADHTKSWLRTKMTAVYT